MVQDKTHLVKYSHAVLCKQFCHVLMKSLLKKRRKYSLDVFHYKLIIIIP